MSSPLEEPALDATEIQGDSLAGFRKDFASFVFVRFNEGDISSVRTWLGSFADQIAYLDSVHAFNTAYSAMRRALGHDPPLSATWVNLAFTFEGLKLLAPDADLSALDPSLVAGAAANAAIIGDPSDGTNGDPRQWLVGRGDQHVCAMITIAGDNGGAVKERTDAIVAEVSDRMTVVRVQPGNVRSCERGHEHFGFKDGISQPGIRGRLGADGPFVTARLLNGADPLSTSFAAPGQPLLWPGEFVLGYPRKVTGATDPNKTVVDAIPPWMRNGSYVVFRMLSQDVPLFRKSVASEAVRIAALPGFEKMSADKLGALIVGRWASGAPVMRAPHNDDAEIASDLEASNSFFFARDTPEPKYAASSQHTKDPSPRAMKDSTGVTCPFSAHIRKVNPRDEITDQGSAARTLEHRILRRGIPYGTDYDPARPESAAEERGLLFVCYQASIQSGFEFLSRTWANSPDAPHDEAGQDLIIGQNGSAPRALVLKSSAETSCTASMASFVTARGGAYLFAPSRTALKTTFGTRA